MPVWVYALRPPSRFSPGSRSADSRPWYPEVDLDLVPPRWALLVLQVAIWWALDGHSDMTRCLFAVTAGVIWRIQGRPRRLAGCAWWWLRSPGVAHLEGQPHRRVRCPRADPGLDAPAQSPGRLRSHGAGGLSAWPVPLAGVPVMQLGPYARRDDLNQIAGCGPLRWGSSPHRRGLGRCDCCRRSARRDFLLHAPRLAGRQLLVAVVVGVYVQRRVGGLTGDFMGGISNSPRSGYCWRWPPDRVWSLRHPPGSRVSQSTIKTTEPLQDSVRRAVASAPFEPARLFCSDLPRCRQLAEGLANHWNIDLEVTEDLREMNFGEWEGRSYDEIDATDTLRWRTWCENWRNAAPPGGESLDQLMTRVSSWLARQAPSSRTSRHMLG